MGSARESAMDEQLERIIRGMIGAERDRRKIPTARAMAQIKEKIPYGHSARPIALDGEAGREYETRAKLWISIAKRAVSEGGFTWTKERAADTGHLLDTGLLVDWEELVELARKGAGRSVARIDQLDAAKNRVDTELSHELELLVLGEDRSRIPVCEQLAAPRYGAVLTAREKARRHADGTPPDYTNAAKDAVAAVEQLARIVTGKPTASLGDAIKELRGSARIQAPLLKGIEEIWGWASNTAGVRHGAAPALTVDASTARYIIAQSDAALALLLSIDAT